MAEIRVSTPKLDAFIAAIEDVKVNPYLGPHKDLIWGDVVEVLKEIRTIITEVKTK